MTTAIVFIGEMCYTWVSKLNLRRANDETRIRNRKMRTCLLPVFRKCILKKMKKGESYIIVKESLAIMMILMMWKG